MRDPSLDELAWDPLRAIAQWDMVDKEEATWLAFLVTFFGPAERQSDVWEGVRSVYAAFGTRRLSWAEAQREPRNVLDVCLQHHDAYVRLPRGNHRKFEPNAADHPQGIGSAVASYVDVIARHGAGDQTALFAVVGESPDARFSRLMVDLRAVVSLGRTGRYDFLTLLRNLGVYELEPDRIYMVGATGPLSGARRLFGVPGRATSEQEELDERAMSLARAVGVDPQAMEDALCNWQKKL